jgi:predicted NUDIX family phosphoesterase
MSKTALCLRDLQDFERMADGEIEHIAFEFVPRSVCESVDAGWVQLLPYVSFSTLDTARARVAVLGYRRPGSGEGEQRLQGAYSFGFGGHIDKVEDLVYSRVVEAGDTQQYLMTTEDIKATAMKCARREIQEELGFDVFEELGIEGERIHMQLLREESPDEVGQVHLCLSVAVTLDVTRFNELLGRCDPDALEIQELKAVEIDINRYLGSFNVVQAYESMAREMREDLKVEAWSILVINNILTNLVGFVQKHWNAAEVLLAIFTRLEQTAREEQEKSSDEVCEEVPQEDAQLNLLEGSSDAMPDNDTSDVLDVTPKS